MFKIIHLKQTDIPWIAFIIGCLIAISIFCSSAGGIEVTISQAKMLSAIQQVETPTHCANGCDVKGDKSKHIQSISITLGIPNAAKLGGFLILCAVCVSIIPFVLGGVDTIYFIFLIIPNSIMLYSSLKIIFDHSESSAYRIKNILLMGMLLGLIGFLLIGIVIS